MGRLLKRMMISCCMFILLGMSIKQHAYAETLTGTVSISGSFTPGSTLTATVLNSNNTGTLSYRWEFDFGALNIEMERYHQQSLKLLDSDAGHFVSCVVTSSSHSGSISSQAVLVNASSGTGTTYAKPVVTLTKTSQGILVSWTQSAITGYKVYRNELGNPIQMTIATPGPSVTSYLDTAVLKEGSTYEYQVIAYNGSGHKDSSIVSIVYSSSTATPTPTPTPTATPITINNGPWSQEVNYGATVDYYCTASGGSGSLVYTLKGLKSGGSWQDLATQTTTGQAKLSFTATESMTLKLVVSDSSGASKESGTVTLTVKPEEKVDGSAATESTPGVGLDIYADNTLGLNYYVFFTSDQINQRAMSYQIGSEAKVSYSVSQLSVVKRTSTGAFYKLTAPLSAKQMTDKVTFRIEYPNNGGIIRSEQAISVQDYASQIIGDSNYSAIVKSLLNYGAAAQKYFGYNTGNLANSILSSSDKTMNTVGTIGAKETTTSTSGTFNGLTYEGASLVLNDKTELRLYFASNPNVSSAYSATVISSSGASYTGTIKQKGSYYYVAIPDITRNDLRSTFTVSVKQQNTSGTMTVIYQPLYYIETTLKESTDASLKNLMTAFYWFIQS